MSNAGILATRRDGDVLIADEPTHVELAWPELATADGETVAISWSASVCCVDSDADRALLAERYLVGNTSTLAVTRVARDLATAIAPALRAAMSKTTADEVLSDDGAKRLEPLLEREARTAAFAIGLAILSPYRTTVSSPSREQAKRLAETQARLAAVAKQDELRTASLASLARTISETANHPERGARALASIRLADPLDLLRATAIVEPAWSLAKPSLWIAAGTRLVRLDVTRPTLALTEVPPLGDSLGPIRSVNATRIDEADVLLVGARDGVFLVSAEEPTRVIRAFRCDTGSEFGFNAACFLPAERKIVATHSQAGIVTWSLDEPDRPAAVHRVGRARSIVAVAVDRAVLLIDGRLMSYTPGAEPEWFAGAERSLSVTLESADGVRRRKLLREDVAGDTRYAPSAAIEDEIEVGGVPRTIRALAAGGLEMVDSAGATRLPIGPGNFAARSAVARPGFAAAVSLDRTRVLVIDLARPEATHAELNVSTAIGSRIADVCFA